MKCQLSCVECGQTYAPLQVRYRCDCGGTLDVLHKDTALNQVPLETFDRRLASKLPADKSGVWRFREFILPVDETDICTRGEGNTGLYRSQTLANYVGLSSIALKHEGENPTGSFKDRGMTVGITMAKKLGFERVAVASTGNTSASLAAYAAMVGLQAVIFIPNGQIALGKLGQALAYGARTLQIDGDFDDAMALVESFSANEGLYLLNSVNPFRIEGQKAIGFEILQDLDWRVPDWIVVPGGNLGNNSAITKGMIELYELGLIDRLPRVAVIQADGANPLHVAWTGGGALQPQKAKTLATAIKIGTPISFTKSLRGLRRVNGWVDSVSDDDILEAKAVVDSSGIGAEPASCASIAGVRKMVRNGIIGASDKVVAVLTGHVLKDPGIVFDFK
ncbi:MAG: threonine synthase [Myxococcota bacterium]|nr:threonine synthase [Myxococcota bacterium]